jgi:hypothetical protein
VFEAGSYTEAIKLSYRDYEREHHLSASHHINGNRLTKAGFPPPAIQTATPWLDAVELESHGLTVKCGRCIVVFAQL